MAQDTFEQLQDEIAGPPPAHVRNINVDTHIGQAPQRPYALLEDRMAQVTLGHRDLASLKAALAGVPRPESLPDGAPDPNEVVEEDGRLVRYVVSQAARDAFVRDGTVYERVQFEPRGVALSQEAARVASQEGAPTDYFNGFTWLRDGYKPEADFAVMAQQANAGAKRDLVFDVEAAPTDVARIRHDIQRLDNARAPMPVEPSAAGRPAAARKEK